MSNSTEKDDARMVKTKSEQTSTGKRSVRLETKKSTTDGNKRELISGKKVPRKLVSKQISKRNQIGKKNECKENDSDDNKAGSDDLRRNNSTDELDTEVARSEPRETRKKSARIEAKKSSSFEDEKESSLGKHETKKPESGKTRRGNRLAKKKESEENDSDDNKSGSDDPRRNNSTDDSETEAAKHVEPPKARKKSARLEAKKSTSSENEKHETKESESGKTKKGTRLAKKNESEENDSDDNKSGSDDPRRNNSTDDAETEAAKHIEPPKTRKKSARLEAKKSTSFEDEKHETKESESGKTKRGTRLAKKNESEENDSDDNKSGVDDLQSSSSNKDLKKTENKFFKSKTSGSDGIRTIRQTQGVTMKNKRLQNSNNRTTKKESLGYVPPVSLRQPTLSESFSRGVKYGIRLRPRKSTKDCKDEANEAKTDKEPVYKTVVKLIEDDKITEDKDSIYDFEFDANDPEEKPIIKKKPNKVKSVKKPAANKKKNIKLLPKNNNNEPIAGPEESSENNPVPPETEDKTTKLAEIIIEEENEKLDVLPQDLPAAEKAKEDNRRVKISSVEVLKGNKMISFEPEKSLSRQSSAKFNPFRSTQSLFKPRSNLNSLNMMDHSLLNKSLSPIKVQMETFDPASPWRPPVPVSFSTVKQLVQSTPQAKQNYRNFGAKLEFKIDEKDEDQNTEAKKNQNPLGVKISNIENIQNSNSNINETDLTNRRETNSSPSKFTIGKRPTNCEENKENSGFGDRLYISPKKKVEATSSAGSPGVTRRRNNHPLSRTEAAEEDENSMPAEEPKLLKQSNLRGFLNMDEMPESVTINTTHGIFGDGVATTPVLKSQIFKTQASQASVENCFGFDDDLSNSDSAQVSPTKIKSDAKKIDAFGKKKTFNRLKRRDLSHGVKERRRAARISLGEIKNTLYPRRKIQLKKLRPPAEEENSENKELDIENDKETKSKKTETKPGNVICPVQFSDTFDVLSETGCDEVDDKSLGNEIALFADLEPVHFTQPPRWSYAKKRERKQFCTSDEDDEDEADEKKKKPVLKKRKLTKLNKIEEKKINEWVKSVNETFQEIDEFDLVVEKL